MMNDTVRLECNNEGLVTIWLASVDRSVNVFDAAMISGLEGAVAHVAARPEQYTAVVFRSAKPSGFFAGADVNAIAAITDEPVLQAILERGQRLMQSIEQLPLPTIALIDGVCMGGGLEFALACRHRVASDSASTQLGLPEIKLGLIPGWGGTQRLPQRIGVQRALEMILKGNAISSATALRYGLVDMILSPSEWDENLSQLVNQLTSHVPQRPTRHLTFTQRMLNQTSVGRSILFYMTRKKLAAPSLQYPAILEAIAAVESSVHGGVDGYAVERAAFSRLLFGSTARSLLGLFQQRDRAKKIATWVDTSGALNDEHFGQVAVIGAGAMGAGIGALAAMKGYQVVFKELNDSALEAGRQRVADLLATQADRKRLPDADRQAILQRIEYTTDWDQLVDCDLAIEAVLEIDEVKQEVFEKLNRRLSSQAVLTTNTSSLSVTRMATATTRHGHVAGLHFFNPVERMELVELVRTEACDERTIQRLLNFVKSLGKTPIVTSDKPGFLVNRVLFPYLGEAVRMVSEGYSIKDLDHELRSFGMPMGPLELLDQVGIDIASHVAQSLAAVQPDATIPAKFLSDMAAKGWLGKKAKLGFYDYLGKRSRPNARFNRLGRHAFARYEFLDDQMTPVQRRLVYAMLNEAVHCLDEQVVAEPWMVDLGMVLGTGFAPMHGGPLRLVDSLGLPTVQHNLLGLAQLHGERFSPADGINRLARRNGKFLSHLAVVHPTLAKPVVS